MVFINPYYQQAARDAQIMPQSHDEMMREADRKEQYAHLSGAEEPRHVKRARTVQSLNKVGQVVQIGEELIPFEIPLPGKGKEVISYQSASYAIKGRSRQDGSVQYQTWTGGFSYERLALDNPQVAVYRRSGDDGPWQLKEAFFAPYASLKEEVFAEWWKTLPQRDQREYASLRWTMEFS